MKIKPSKLKPGDTIGIVAPSAGVYKDAKHRIDRAILFLEKLGFKVKLGKSVFVDDLSEYVSGSIEERVSDMHYFFSDKDVKMIVCAIGGNHSNQLLSELDYDLIRNNPKIFLGYSDMMVLHYALYTQSDLITYYGPCAATQMGEFPDVFEYTKKHFVNTFIDVDFNPHKLIPSEKWTDEFLDWFKQEDLERPRVFKKNNGYRWIVPGKASGKLLPACIYAVNHTLGTKYWIDPSDKILFLDLLFTQGELTESSTTSFLYDLYNADVFKKIKGLVISRPFNYTEESKENIYKLINTLIIKSEVKYPVVAEVDFGHTDPMLTLEYDKEVFLDSSADNITF